MNACVTAFAIWATTCCAFPELASSPRSGPFRPDHSARELSHRLKLVAKEGWPFQQHSLSLAEDKLTASTFEEVNKTTPIANLRWSIAHVPHIDQETVNRFKALGAGIAVHPFEYLAGGPNAGPPLRMILDSGIHAGAGSDAAQISTLDPWPMIYYMVTGKNSSGVLINDKQQLTRTEALRLYTAENGWFFHEENTSDNRGGQARRHRRAQRRLLRSQESSRRSHQAPEIRADGGRRQSGVRPVALIPCDTL